ncbi:hypothetical protein [Streptomyces botrytidirepellens]|nr:hypothetical protein [Streptomyces botrytidirepellens]
MSLTDILLAVSWAGGVVAMLAAGVITSKGRKHRDEPLIPCQMVKGGLLYAAAAALISVSVTHAVMRNETLSALLLAVVMAVPLGMAGGFLTLGLRQLRQNQVSPRAARGSAQDSGGDASDLT